MVDTTITLVATPISSGLTRQEVGIPLFPAIQSDTEIIPWTTCFSKMLAGRTTSLNTSSDLMTQSSHPATDLSCVSLTSLLSS